MKFLKFLRRFKDKGSSRSAEADPELLGADLFAQLTYMAAISEAGVSRSQLFEYGSRLPYTSSVYFKKVYFLAQKLHFDYAQACRVVGEKIKGEQMRSLLLRLSGSLSSGESETEFLQREAQAHGDQYGNRYEQDVETLKKWTDAYVSLVVAGVIVVIVSVISMLMFSLGVMFLMALTGATVSIMMAGAWLIYRVAPHEIKTHSLPRRSSDQIRARAMLKILLPASAAASVIVLLIGAPLASILVVAPLILLPVGLIMRRDDRNIGMKDRDITAVVRALGGVTSAVGTTIGDSLGKIEQRSMGSLTPDIQRLRNRLDAGISPDLCWHRFVGESGSEMVSRTVQMFYDGIKLGGEPERIGLLSSVYSMKISLLRTKRQLVSSTFNWLIIPLHISLTALLVFILQVMIIMQNVLEEFSIDDIGDAASSLPATAFSGFSQGSATGFVWLVTFIILVLTAANAFAPKAAEGGHNLKLLYNLGIMSAISGANMLLIPRFVNSIFSSVAIS